MPLVRCEINLFYGALACSERQPLCKVSSRSPAMAFYYVLSSLRGFPGNHSNALIITKNYNRRTRAHLAVSTDPVSYGISEGAIV